MKSFAPHRDRYSRARADLPRQIKNILQQCPQAGDGVHNWVYRTALSLLCRGWSIEAASSHLMAAVTTCGRLVPQQEITEAVQNAALKIAGGQRPMRRNSIRVCPPFKRVAARTDWPSPSQEAIEAISASEFGLVDLYEASPVRYDDADAEYWIDVLFPPDALICCGWTQYQFDTRLREEWRGQLSRMQFIVPSVMTARMGVTKNGKSSAHTLSNTGPRCFIVIEFDSGTSDSQAARLWHLATEMAPLALALHSGGKSLHGWFPCHGQPEQRVRRFMEVAVRIGADKATWTPLQFVRIPAGQRLDKKKMPIKQRVYYFNPATL